MVGLPGVGKSTLARKAVADFNSLVFTCPPLPAPAQCVALASRIGNDPASPHPPADWQSVFHAVLRAARTTSQPWVLVLDDAHRLSEARARFLPALFEVLNEAREDAVPVHVLLVGPETGLPDEKTLIEGGPTTTIRVGPLPLRAAAPHLPGSEASEKVRAYGVFGGIPRVLGSLDTSVNVGTNVRRLMLSDEGPLASAPLAWLEGEVQTPTRYLAILRALADGPADWATIHAGVPDLTRGGQVAPYLKRLGELGMLETRTPLDAHSRSRTTRYSLTDPFLAFWLRFVLPWRMGEQRHTYPVPMREHYADAIRPKISPYLESVMPRVAQQHMQHDAIETLGTNARECGSLWGQQYDLPVAGILASGAAFYGKCFWRSPASEEDPLAALDSEIRETRYGFGRERRLRLCFTGRTAPTWLRRQVARRSDAELIDAGALLGE